jgi:hypothetical protein
MATRRNLPPAPVLPLPPTEYDAEYMTNVIRLLNFFIQQTDNPGVLRAARVELANDTVAPRIVIDPGASGATKVILTGLPTSSAGLATGQLWNSVGTVRIV